jgi:hypothetical protein
MNTDPPPHEFPVEGKSSLEEELAWCMAQLEIGCARKGATKEQKELNLQIMKKLQSAKTPLPKKRQIMRNVFGDYRSKMAADPLHKPAVPSFISSSKSTLPPGGSFYRVAASSAPQLERSEVSVLDDVSSQSHSTSHTTNGGFKFSFDIDQ